MAEIDKKSSSSTPHIVDLNLDLEALKGVPSVVKLYANSFTLGFSVSDATIVLQNGKTPTGVVNVSFTALKTLFNALGETIYIIEKNLGHPILDNKETSILFAKNNSSSTESKN